IGSTSTFAFSAYGGVVSDQTVRAQLVASSTRALGYLDSDLAASEDNITSDDIISMIERFSDRSYPIVNDAFGEPSDVDANGKVIFLFTHLVDNVGGVAGFYSSRSLFEERVGGNGNEADMMFISPTRSLDSYESLLAHEYQHLVSFNQHVLVKDGDAEEAWLNEALSHYTEDLVDGHIAGGNPSLIDEFLNNPGAHSLTGDASFNGGIRGAAYLFLRSLVEDYGTSIPGQLVRTDQVGISNVVAATSRSFTDLYAAWLQRLFGSGTGLNSAAAYNYTYEHYADPSTGHRALPTPNQATFVTTGAPVSGTVKAAAPAFVRLKGTGVSESVTIDAETSGQFRALLITLPKGFVPQLALPVDRFPGITLSSPLPGVYTAGEGVTLSGTIQDASITQLLLTFESRAGDGSKITFDLGAQGTQFARSIVFDPSQAGEYTMALFAGKQGEWLPEVGRLSGAIVTEGSGTVNLPESYFPGITLDAPFPATQTAGTGGSFAGRVTNPSSGIEALIFVFTPASGDPIQIQTTASGGTFQKGFVFTPAQAGTYKLDVYGGPSGGSLPHLGSYEPITVTSTGSERVFLPVDMFDGVLLDAPMEASFFAGKQVRVTGSVKDPSITQILFRFDPAGGTGEQVRTFVDVSSGRFDAALQFSSSQTGTYTLVLFGGPQGQLLSGVGSFSPVQVLVPQPDLSLSLSALSWNDLPVGEHQDLSLTIRNFGSQALSISGIVSDNAAFSPSTTSFTVAAGDSATVTIAFTPTGVGLAAGTLQISSNDPDLGTAKVSLSGTGVAAPSPQLVLRPTALDFGSTTVGNTSEQTLTLLNSGAADLKIDSIAGPSDPFNAVLPTVTPVFQIAPGDSATVKVTFSPTEAGTFTDKVTISGNVSTVELIVSGAGLDSSSTEKTPDFTGDGRVSFEDFVLFAQAFGSDQSSPGYDSRFDLNGDGAVNFSDFVTFATAFGKTL
ncbi:MAG: choice-of-anchor D domain-containing protein, partial [Candidatus Latescibacteria bacterium]|nr:choice-of-anchor D domain-containing protein [Candidatus Latescibacterota bacterium]